MLIRIGILCLCCVFVRSKFTPVDISPLTKDPLDPTRLTDAAYFQSWLTNVYDPVAVAVIRSEQLAYWDYETNITAENDAASVASAQLVALFIRVTAEIVKQFDLSKSPDVKMRDIATTVKELGDAALSTDEFSELVSVVNNMSEVYSTAEICFDPNDSVTTLDQIKTLADCPEGKRLDISGVSAFFRNDTWESDRRRYVWKAWRDASGAVVRENYLRYIDLKNKGAQLTGYRDTGHYWRSAYTADSLNYTDEVLLQDLENLWQQLRPLYGELHAYVRRKLIQKFPYEYLSPTGPIPAHLLGDIFSLDWSAMLSFTQLFPFKPLLDVTDEMVAQNYTVDRIFRLSEKFQIDLGLIPMPNLFWDLSLFEKPTDGRDVVCAASSWDMFSKGDVRIKMCTEINMDYLSTVHHEMGHVQYFLQYADRLSIYRDGANSGFHEAVGDTLAMSVKTPKHLALIGLLKNDVEDKESNLNYLYATALETIAFLPFGYILDRYRYDVFSGKIGKDKLNQGWWDYALKYQGIVPPVPRSERDFDPGAKYHIDADIEYMRYFISSILQFQFYKALCVAAGHQGPLYQCDINGSKAAGKLLSSMLSLGASEPWPVALERIAGTRKMDAGPILEFFQPLTEYLKDLNVKNGDKAGW